MIMDPRYRYFDRRMDGAYSHAWSNVHEDCRHALFNYLVQGFDPGGFLTAVLTNDLYMAAGRADIENVKRLAWVARLVINAVPRCCYGSVKVMEQWMSRSNKERETILINAGVLPTLFEVIKDPC